MAAAPPSALATLVAEEHLATSVLVEGIPVAAREATEDAVVTLFATAGPLARLIIQTVEGGGSQRAVVSYTTAASAEAALALHGTEMLGSDQIRVLPIASLDASASAEALGGASPSPNPYAVPADETPAQAAAREAGVAQRLQQAVVALLATGIFMGERGAVWLRETDQKVGLSEKICLAVEQTGTAIRKFDEENAITTRMNAVFGTLGQQVSETATDLDSRLGVSTRVSDVSENPTVQRAVGSVNQGVGAVVDWSLQTWASASEQARARQGEEAEANPPPADDGHDSGWESESVPEEYGEALPESTSGEMPTAAEDMPAVTEDAALPDEDVKTAV